MLKSDRYLHGGTDKIATGQGAESKVPSSSRDDLHSLTSPEPANRIQSCAVRRRLHELQNAESPMSGNLFSERGMLIAVILGRYIKP